MFILHGEDSDWVHGGDERGEEERLEQAGRVVLAVDAGLAAAPQREAWTRGSGGCTVYCVLYCTVLCTVYCSARMLGPLTDRDNVENSSDHRHQQYCAQMIEKQSINN